MCVEAWINLEQKCLCSESLEVLGDFIPCRVLCSKDKPFLGFPLKSGWHKDSAAFICHSVDPPLSHIFLRELMLSRLLCMLFIVTIIVQKLIAVKSIPWQRFSASSWREAHTTNVQYTYVKNCFWRMDHTFADRGRGANYWRSTRNSPESVVINAFYSKTVA